MSVISDKRVGEAQPGYEFPLSWVCPEKKKVAYLTSELAIRRIHEIKRQPRTHYSPKGTYQCEGCRGWLLTSSPQPGALVA